MPQISSPIRTVRAVGPVWLYQAAALVVLAALLVLLAGCQAAEYRAGCLPLELSAPPRCGVQQLDLSRLAACPARNDVLQAGDLIEISIATGLETEVPAQWPVRIAHDGTAEVPLVGIIPLGGLSLPDAEAAIRQASIQRNLYRDPQVTVQLENRHVNRVTVIGAVEKPGAYELPAAGSDLLSALVAAGGLSKDASTLVEIRHPSGIQPSFGGLDAPGVRQAAYRGQPLPERTAHVDLQEAAAGGAGDYHVEDGSVVTVMKHPPRTVYVMGLVKNANRFEVPDEEDLRLLDALALAGGRTLEVADKVRVIRIDPRTGKPVVIAASVREAKRNGAANILLAAGDVVTVEETPLTATIESLRNFMRFGFTSAIPGF